MGKSSSQTVGYRYFVGAQFLLSHGPVDAVVEAEVDRRRIFLADWTSGIYGVSKPELFGGEGREGGVVGEIELQHGEPTQGENDYLKAKQNGGAAIPGYRGVLAVILRQVEIGMNPYLKPWAFRVRRVDVTHDGAAQWYIAKAGIPREVATEENADAVSFVEGDGLVGAIDLGFNESRTINFKSRLQKDDLIIIYSTSDDFTGQLDSDLPLVDPAQIGELPTGLWANPWPEISYHRVGTTPPNSITVTHTNNSVHLTVMYAVFRNVKTSGSPFVLSPASAGTVDSAFIPAGVPNPPAATPISLRDMKISFGAIDDTLAPDPDLVGWELAASSYGGNSTGMIFYKSVEDLAEEDPPAVTLTGTDAWGATHWHLAAAGDSSANIIDMNPAHIIRECLTNTEWGLGFTSGDIGTSFTAVADTLYDESFGLSFRWTQEIEVDEFMQEVLNHINAYLYVDRRTGLWELKLIRDDYSVGSLPRVEENDVLSIGNDFERINPAEAVNSITVKYRDSKTGDQSSMTIQDTSLVAEAGKIISTTVTYNGVHVPGLASKIGLRDLISLSSPILTGTISVKRTLSTLNPGDAFVLDLPRYGINNEIMRVVGFEEYGIGEEAINMKMTSDAFAIGDVSVITEERERSGEATAPLPVVYRYTDEAPYFDLAQLAGDTEAESQTSNNPDIGYVVTTPGNPGGAAINALMSVAQNGGAYYEDYGVVDFSPYALLDAALTDSPTDTTVAITGGSDLDEAVVGDIAVLGGTEIVKIVALTSSSVTLGRGCLDTLPKAHAAGELLMFYRVGWDIIPEEYLATETVKVKLRTVNGGGVVSTSQSPTDTVTFNSRAYRPLPPGNFKVDGAFSGHAALDGSVNVVLTWAYRDRLTQTGGDPVIYTDGDVGPEAGTTYDVLIEWLDEAGAVTGTALVDTNAGTVKTYTLLSGFMASRPAAGVSLRFTVSSLRDAYTSLEAPSITVPLAVGYGFGYGAAYGE